VQVVEFERSQLGKGGKCELRAVEQPGEKYMLGVRYIVSNLRKR